MGTDSPMSPISEKGSRAALGSARRTPSFHNMIPAATSITPASANRDEPHGAVGMESTGNGRAEHNSPFAVVTMGAMNQAHMELMRACMEGTSARSIITGSGGGHSDPEQSEILREMRRNLAELKKSKKEAVEEIRRMRIAQENTNGVLESAERTMRQLEASVLTLNSLPAAITASLAQIQTTVDRAAKDNADSVASAAELKLSLEMSQVTLAQQFETLKEENKKLCLASLAVFQDAKDETIEEIKKSKEEIGGRKKKAVMTKEEVEESEFRGPSRFPAVANSLKDSVSEGTGDSPPRRRDSHAKLRKFQWCPYCSSNSHQPTDCWRMPSLSDRKSFLEKDGRCLCCLKRHYGMCRFPEECIYCEKSNHHSSLCEKLRHLDHLESLK